MFNQIIYIYYSFSASLSRL